MNTNVAQNLKDNYKRSSITTLCPPVCRCAQMLCPSPHYNNNSCDSSLIPTPSLHIRSSSSYRPKAATLGILLSSSVSSGCSLDWIIQFLLNQWLPFLLYYINTNKTRLSISTLFLPVSAYFFFCFSLEWNFLNTFYFLTAFSNLWYSPPFDFHSVVCR